jgi:uncharacterized repeat protein (TIGR01451 family)
MSQIAAAGRARAPVNGVDTPSPFRAINVVREQPDLARFRASNRWLGRVLSSLALASFLAPAAARAELMIPVTVKVVGLTQRDDVDPVPPNLGDLFAEVTINGQKFDNIDDQCRNDGTTGFILPFRFFSEGGPTDPSCKNVPWTFQADVPLSAFKTDGLTNVQTIPVQIKIVDEDTVFNDTVRTVDLKLTVNGRWSGSAEWPQNCVTGGRAEVCWRIDTGQDSDGDGLLDDWETNGVDTDGNGTVDFNLPALGANPMHKDLFVELDWRQGFPPKRAEVQKVRDAFARAPVDAGGVPNPDGLPGITLHIDTGSLTENGLLVGDNLGGGNALPGNFPVCELDGGQYGLYAAKATNFDPRRAMVFRYGVVSTHCCTGGPNAGNVCLIDVQCGSAKCQLSGGRGEIGGNDFVTWNYDDFLGSTLLHEIGHTLDLHHGGDVDDNCKPNYLSVMNYDHMELQRLNGTTFIDFSPPLRPNGSRGSAPLPPLAENALDETALVLDPSDTDTLVKYTDANRLKRLSPVGQRIDWEGDGDKTGTGLTVNIDTSNKANNYPELCENTDFRSELPNPPGPLTGHHDWARVSLPFLQFANSDDGPVNAVDVDEPNERQLRQQFEAVNTTDLAVATNGDPGPYEAGSEVELGYVVKAENQGPAPALPLLVEDTLPAGATLVSTAPACTATATGTLNCRHDGVLEGEAVEVPISIKVTGTCTAGIPVAIVNRANVANGYPRAGADPDPADNTSSFTTQVVDTTPPQLTVTASPAQLWAPNHTLVTINVAVNVIDVCDDSPDVRLVRVTSNEGTLADGSGHTSPDVAGAAFGTDDRTFQLRAERSGINGGRIYTVTYEAVDRSGNVTTATTTVTVVKSQTPR